jgi:hypothetical protein
MGDECHVKIKATTSEPMQMKCENVLCIGKVEDGKRLARSKEKI